MLIREYQGSARDFCVLTQLGFCIDGINSKLGLKIYKDGT